MDSSPRRRAARGVTLAPAVWQPRSGRRRSRCGGGGALLHHHTRAAGRLDALARAGAEGMGVDGELLVQLALGEDLDGNALAGAQALALHQLDRHLGAGLETFLQRADVDRLSVRAEGLEGNLLLHVR